ncbi:lysophospholipase L1-like esterase [Streptomyces sp. SAI-135]|nr:lysophospholipase L1-like esterase [Streptomyces sp. SAI-090]MDH6554675.1 lysophospholipase L1-like esterase [Streptomyces sp. SAI-041]MDH6573945.1 lysophospholipase L1-like esterase [Streptomyces sp. SAI-117]MDH6581318.1 lysophospholipase L1-like esterase [Streptomyces sp. SAI-133]MDH6613325.1 lysophospholipase L1-like esterase [Streptomyces sp. SAI-135]
MSPLLIRALGPGRTSKAGRSAGGLVLVLAATVLAACAPTKAASTSTEPAQPATSRAWFTSWASSQQGVSSTSLSDQSVRMISHLSQGGDALRVRVQNTFGQTSLTVNAATVAHSDGSGPATEDKPVPVTFAGRKTVVVPAGGEVWSDPARIRTAAQDDVAVSLSVSGTVAPGIHNSAFRTNYLTPPGSGDHTADASGAPFTETTGSTYLVSAVDVHNPRLRGTLVAYGSSVVDGVGSTNCGPGCERPGANLRWTDDVARRITRELPANQRFTVANAGIAGTTSAATCSRTDPALGGLEGVNRLERDVLALHGVTGVLYYYGTNDLVAGCGAGQILDSYRDVFRRLHAAGIKVYVTPITPRPGYTDQNNKDRNTVGLFVSKWNNCAGTCDGVLPFDQVLRDPLKPNSIHPSYDVGDGIHANISGQEALADIISLPMLAASASP